MIRYSILLYFGFWLGINAYAQSIRQLGFTQQGKASYYPDDRNRAKTRSGEIYDMRDLTAAHADLAFNSVIRVTNLETNREAVLRINDRPYTNERVLDVTLAAAKQLGMIGKKNCSVKIEVIALDVSKDIFPTFLASLEKKLMPTETLEKKPEKATPIISPFTDAFSGKTANPHGIGLQVGLFTELTKAQQKAKQLQEHGFKKVFIQNATEKEKSIFKVIVGEYPSKEKAQSDALRLKKLGYDCFVRSY